MAILRHVAFLSSVTLLLAAIGSAVSGFPPAIPMQFPESRAAVEALLQNHGTASYAAGIGFDRFLIPIYVAQISAWVVWVVFGLGEKERPAMAAAVGVFLMTLAAAYWDSRENAGMLDLFGSFDAGRLNAFELLPLLTAASRKWGYLGFALLLAGIANGFGMWTRRATGISARRIRTWACMLGGLAGMSGGSALLPGLGVSTRWMLFHGAALGLALAGATVLVETWPKSRRNR